MNKTKSFLALTCLFFILSYNIFAQTADQTAGCSPLEVQFFAPNGSATFFWDFQDNATSTLENPLNTFVDPGTYEVEFRETVGGPIVGTVTITVFPTPVLEMTAAPIVGCTPLNVNFENNSIVDPNITVNNYQWVFGDGGVDSGTSPTHTYTDEGLFTVSLNIETNFESCNVTEIFPDVVTASAVTGLSFTTDPTPATACTPPLVIAVDNMTTDNDPLTYQWTFGNGSTSSQENPGAETYNSEGLFNIVLTATDDLGCTASFSESVFIGSPQASFTIPDTICINGYYDMINTSDPGSYLWNFGPNQDPQVTTAANPDSVFFPVEGFQDITLTVSSDGCVGDTTRTVYVEDPDATFTADPVFSCVEPLIVTFDPVSDLGVNWYWDYDYGTDDIGIENPTHEFNHDDVTIYSKNGGVSFFTILTIEYASGCKAMWGDHVALNEPNALFVPDVISGCAPLTVELTDDSHPGGAPILQWDWDYGDGQTANFTNNDVHTHTFENPGTYEVELSIINDLDCRDTSYLMVFEVGDSIPVDFEVDVTEVCPGDSVQFTNLTLLDNVDAWHFTTDNNRSFHCYDEPDLTWAYVQETGPMDVSLTVEYNGCYSTLTQEDLITVKGPIAQFHYQMDCTNPYEYFFENESMEATSGVWDFGDGNFSTLNNPTHTYAATGDYWVKITAENNLSGCPASVDSMQVFVREIQAAFELDTLLCSNLPYELDASASVDVDATCWRGYSWYTTFNRPITLQDSVISLNVPPGEQNITLVTRDVNGCKDTASLDVKSFEIDPIFETDDTRICLPAEVNFTDVSIGDTTLVAWEWNFDDGATSFEQNPIHVYGEDPAADTFNVELLVIDAIGCEFRDTQDLIIYKPVSFILSSPTPAICVGEPIELSGTDFILEGSNLEFEWDFDNGTTATGQSNTTSYDMAGNYLVKMYFEEIGSGCNDSTFLNIQVQEYPEAAFISSFDSLGVLCAPQNALFTNESASLYPLDYFWDFDNGQTSSDENPGASFDKGTFEVQLLVSTPFGCSDSITSTYTLVGPEGDFILDPDMICLGESINFTLLDTADISSFSWDFGDGSGADDVSPISHQYNFVPPTGQTVATLVLRSTDDACIFAIEQDIFIHEILADFLTNDGVDTTACIDETVMFVNNSTGEDTYSWNFGDGTNSTLESPTNTFTQPGVYDVSLTVTSTDFGCSDDIVKTVSVFGLPSTIAIGDTICEGDEASLSIFDPSDGSTYSWSPASLLNSNDTPTPTTATLSESTNFMVTELDENGCENSTATNVEVIPAYPSMVFEDVICEDGTAFLPFVPNSDYSYEWSPSLTDCDTCTVIPVENVSESIIYTLTATDIFGLGCDPSISTYELEVIFTSVEIPNAFTPDGDGVNDYFNPIISETLSYDEVVLDFKVWNRFGQLVYDNDNPSVGWDGTYKGRPAPSDVYIFTVNLATDDCNLGEKVGDVTLIR